MKLKERPMTPTEAMKVFDIQEIPDSVELKNLYHKLAKQYHTDTGASSTEKMQDINNAYEVLSKIKVSSNSSYHSETPEERKAREKAQFEKAEENFNTMRDIFYNSFNDEELIAYLSQFSSDALDIKITENKFTDEFNRKYNLYSSGSAYFEANVEVFNEDRSLVYYVQFSISRDRSASGLGSSDIDEEDVLFNFGIITNIFYNNRKQKLTQRDYQSRKGKKF